MSTKKHNINMLKEFAEKKGGKCLSNEYINAHTKYLWEDEEGFQWEAKWCNIKNGNWSSNIANKNKSKNLRKYTIDDLKEFAEKKGGKCLSEKYINDKFKYIWEDKDGVVFKKSWWDVRAMGYWSPKQKSEKLRKLKTKYTIDYLKEFAKDLGGKCISDTYIGVNSSYIWEDSEGNQFTRTWTKVKKCDTLVHYNSISNGQQEIIDFLTEIGVDDLSINDRTLINPYEVDILSHKHKIAIEFNGLKYHNTSCKEITVDYHKDKTELVESKGYKLLQIYDLEWNTRKNQVKSFIRAAYGKCSNRLYARNCKVTKIDSDVCSEFLNRYHILGGNTRGQGYGLYHDDILVAVVMIGIHPNKRDDSMYLNRFCVKNDYYIIGGLSKLVKYAKKDYETMYTWLDRRFTNPNNWVKSGWTIVDTTKPVISYYDINKKKLYRNRKGREELVCVYDCGKIKLKI